MEDDAVDFYGVLNVTRGSSPDEIRKAYKALVRRWHPDKNPPSSKKEAESKFRAITQAYEALIEREQGTMFGSRKELRQSSNRSPSPSVKNFNQAPPRRANSDGRHRYFAKPPPVERQLECTLEELCKGCDKEIRFTRNILDRSTGKIVKAEEVHTVRVKPGWKKGTRVTFEGKGDEAGDVVYVVAEKEHAAFKRVGNDLVLKMEVPLVNALTGHSFSFRLLGGEKMSCSLHDEIIYHGSEKIIRGQGMPLAKDHRRRGDLRIKFHVVFPTHLSDPQRLAIKDLLNHSPSS
ncbi:uncharacterized protein LOC144705146 [Wolffia australiana]